MSFVKQICRVMEKIAPLRLAEKWDNVGLLLEAPERAVHPKPRRVLLTIDLTTAVANEAIEQNASVIVAYHPAIFKPLSSITFSNPIQASLLRCAAAGISVYSPHTALDCIHGGINDWLCQVLARGLGAGSYKTKCIGEETELGGQGRLLTFNEPMPMATLEQNIKIGLKLPYIQVACTPVRPLSDIRSVAICAGSGGSILLGVDADVYFTGEMSHHEILAAVASGHNIVLCGHSNTERGYLPILAQNLHQHIRAAAEEETDETQKLQLQETQILISKADRDPLEFR
ncbi:NGG1p interacting factor 3 [Obba rivulosa]|uniref:NGG1p interacting factor 3 n=1 Tax=Obba rivulosa TaxID=1052685 RepID=A0A8E2AXE9_9APHY|nr:NGG1p interacting factor 3 [Obba rivulosa]